MNIFNLFATLKLDGKQYEKGVDDAEKKTEGFGKKTESVFSGIGKAALGLGAAGVGIAGVLGKIGVGYNIEMENYMTSFTTMLGGADKATKHINDLKVFAAKTPFEMTDLAEASQKLLAFGGNVEDVQPDLKMLGDISQGNGEKFKSLSLVFGQVSSQGKLMGGDLLQMINAGFNPLLIISQKTGKSMSQLKDEMSKGQISFDMVKDAMKSATSEGGMFFNAMESQSKTLSGQWSTLKDNFNSILGEALIPVNAFIRDNLLPGINSMFEDIQKGEGLGQIFYDLFTPITGEGIATDIADIGDKIQLFGKYLIDNKDGIMDALAGITAAFVAFKTELAIAWLIEALSKALTFYKTTVEGATIAQTLLNIAMMANPIGILIGLIALLVGAFTWAWQSSEEFRNAQIQRWEELKLALKIMVDAFIWGMDTLVNSCNAAGDWINNKIDYIGSVLSKIPQAIGIAVEGASIKFRNFTEWLGNSLEYAGSLFFRLKDTIINTLSELPGKMWDIGSNIVTGIWEGIKNKWDWLIGNVGGVASGLVDKAKGFLGIHSPSRVFRDEVGKWIPAGIWEGIKNGMPDLQSNLDYSIDNMVDSAKPVINGINPQAVSSAGTVINQTINTKAVLSPYEISMETKNTFDRARWKLA